MASYYDDLVGWLEEEDREAIENEARRNQQTEKEAGEAFDKMMGNPEKEVDNLFKKIWKGHFI
jgi:hypothetical protein